MPFISSYFEHRDSVGPYQTAPKGAALLHVSQIFVTVWPSMKNTYVCHLECPRCNIFIV